MSVSRTKLEEYLNDLLNISAIPKDGSNNGIQVEGKNDVKKIVGAVDASAELFEKAIAMNADFIVVHHGLSWYDSFKRLTGITANRLKMLFNNDVTLYAAHLPLDAHPEIGHNAKLAKLLTLKNSQPFAPYSGAEIGFCGEFESAKTLDEITTLLDSNLNGTSRVIPSTKERFSSVGVISGGGGLSGLEACIEHGLELYITGEMDHTLYHIAKEANIAIIASGHYATETIGVKAVLETLEKRFNVECEFIDIPTHL
jgi:dinuclear metal center YbgI/SA1388 family protein